MFRRHCAWTFLICVGFVAGYAAAQTQPAANPPATAPTTPVASAKTAVAPLPDPQTPEEFFARARQLSDLEASGIPFHLKATYVATGDAEFTGNGTYEEWWQSKDLWRKEATLGDYKYVEIRSGGKHSIYGSSDYVPLRLRQVLDGVLVRIPAGEDASAMWDLNYKTIKGINFAILSKEDPCHGPKSKLRCVTQDYITLSGFLRIHVKDSAEAFYNALQPFHGLLISRNIRVAGDRALNLTIVIDLLEPLGANEKMLAAAAPIPVGVQPIGRPLNVQPDSRVRPPKLISSAEPLFPVSERRLRPRDVAVVITCQVDKKGIVREPYVLISAGPDFDESALNAVRRYRFAPATQNGQPEIVNLDVAVDFHLF
jgi:TonB family protein